MKTMFYAHIFNHYQVIPVEINKFTAEGWCIVNFFQCGAILAVQFKKDFRTKRAYVNEINRLK